MIFSIIFAKEIGVLSNKITLFLSKKLIFSISSAEYERNMELVFLKDSPDLKSFSFSSKILKSNNALTSSKLSYNDLELIINIFFLTIF